MIMSLFMDPNNGSSTTKKPELTMIVENQPRLFETREDLAGGQYDFGNAGDPGAQKIFWFVETGFTENVIGVLYTFHALLLRLLLVTDGTEPDTSNGDLIRLTVVPMDGSVPVAPPTNTLKVINPPAKMYNKPIGDVVAEKVKVRLAGANSLLLRKLILWVADKAQTRPRE